MSTVTLSFGGQRPVQAGELAKGAGFVKKSVRSNGIIGQRPPLELNETSFRLDEYILTVPSPASHANQDPIFAQFDQKRKDIEISWKKKNITPQVFPDEDENLVFSRFEDYCLQQMKENHLTSKQIN